MMVADGGVSRHIESTRLSDTLYNPLSIRFRYAYDTLSDTADLITIINDESSI